MALNFDPKDKVFTEKYRPTLKLFAGEEIKDKVRKYIEKPETMPNFIFESKLPGTGKTSLVLAMIKELGCDKLILNSSDERNIDMVREKVKQFARTKSLGGKKCIFMDEADGINHIAQDALRPIMERYSDNVFFILTVNNINKLIEPIRSRCVEINFSYPKKEEVNVYLKHIIDNENIDYTEPALNMLIDKFYPSIRNMVLFLQDLKINEKQLIEDNISPNEYIFADMYQALLDKDWMKIKEKILSSDINPRELNSFFWQKAVEKGDIKMIQITCMNEKDISIGADPKIIMVTSLIELVK
jgi:replication factor C small subunit